MLDLTSIMAPYANSPKQVKFIISSEAHDKLREVSRACGQDMSTLVDMLIRKELPEPGAIPAPAPPEEQPSSKTPEQQKDYVFGQ